MLKLYVTLYYDGQINNHNIKFLNVDNIDEAKKIIYLVFPSSIKNGLGVPEDCIAYIMRHTQLLPRQLICILNAIVIQNRREGNEELSISENAVIEGIKSKEQEITNDIFEAYSFVHENALEACIKCIPELPLKFSSSKLQSNLQSAWKKGCLA